MSGDDGLETNLDDMNTRDIKILAVQAAARLSMLDDVQGILRGVGDNVDELTEEIRELRERMSHYPTYEELQDYPSKADWRALIRRLQIQRWGAVVIVLLLASVLWWSNRLLIRQHDAVMMETCQDLNTSNRALAEILGDMEGVEDRPAILALVDVLERDACR